MRTIITTVGTSLLTNKDDRPWTGWKFGSAHPTDTDVLQWLITADPVKASAEIHTWQKLGILDDPKNEKVILVHSQTSDGIFCAECLGLYAEKKKLDIAIRQVNELTYSDAASFNRGLSRFVRLLAELIRSARHHGEAAIAATGGFKAEIAIANLVGALLGAPVYYIYEQFQQLIKLEPIPITLAPNWLQDNNAKYLLRMLGGGACVPKNEIDNILKADNRLEMLLESEEINGEAFVCTNVLGEFAAQLFQTRPVDWPEPCDVLPEDKIKLEDTAHHRPKGWESMVYKIAQNRMVRFIRYDSSASMEKGVRPAKDNATDLYIVLDDNKTKLPLRVESTAKNEDQRRLVIEHLKQTIRF